MGTSRVQLLRAVRRDERKPSCRSRVLQNHGRLSRRGGLRCPRYDVVKIDVRAVARAREWLSLNYGLVVYEHDRILHSR